MKLTFRNVHAPAFGRPYQIYEMLMAEDHYGHTILAAAVSSKSVDTFKAVVQAAKETLEQQLVRHVNGAVAAKKPFGQQPSGLYFGALS